MSTDSYVHPTVARKDRSRLYSWSRPSREMRSKGLQYDSTQVQQCICGMAHLAFHPSLDWFQGNIVSATGDSYEINGTKCHECSTSSSASNNNGGGGGVGGGYNRTTSGSSSDGFEFTAQDADAAYKNRKDKRGQSDRSSFSSTASPSSNDEEESTCGSLDSSLVQSAMERLNLELDNEATYNVYVKDYETGLEHNIKDVTYTMDDDTLRLESENLQFCSNNTLKGSRADVAIAKNLTPRLAQMGLTAFVGELKMTYRDEPCFPVTPDASQWCL